MGDVESSRGAAPWWRDARSRDRAVVTAFGALALLGILFVAFSNYLFAGDQRVMVVTLEQDAGQAKRDGLRAACGSLPGISPVPAGAAGRSRSRTRSSRRLAGAGGQERAAAQSAPDLGEAHRQGGRVGGRGRLGPGQPGAAVLVEVRRQRRAHGRGVHHPPSGVVGTGLM